MEPRGGGGGGGEEEEEEGSFLNREFQRQCRLDNDTLTCIDLLVTK